MFLETWQNSQENTCARVSFLIKLQASGHNEPQRATTTHNDPERATTSHNEPQRATTNHNEPQRTTTSRNKPQWTTTTNNEPQQATTNHNHQQRAATSHSTSHNDLQQQTPKIVSYNFMDTLCFIYNKIRISCFYGLLFLIFNALLFSFVKTPVYRLI